MDLERLQHLAGITEAEVTDENIVKNVKDFATDVAKEVGEKYKDRRFQIAYDKQEKKKDNAAKTELNRRKGKADDTDDIEESRTHRKKKTYGEYIRKKRDIANHEPGQVENEKKVRRQGKAEILAQQESAPSRIQHLAGIEEVKVISTTGDEQSEEEAQQNQGARSFDEFDTKKKKGKKGKKEQGQWQPSHSDRDNPEKPNEAGHIEAQKGKKELNPNIDKAMDSKAEPKAPEAEDEAEVNATPKPPKGKKAPKKIINTDVFKRSNAARNREQTPFNNDTEYAKSIRNPSDY